MAPVPNRKNAIQAATLFLLSLGLSDRPPKTHAKPIILVPISSTLGGLAYSYPWLPFQIAKMEFRQQHPNRTQLLKGVQTCTYFLSAERISENHKL